MVSSTDSAEVGVKSLPRPIVFNTGDLEGDTYTNQTNLINQSNATKLTWKTSPRWHTYTNLTGHTVMTGNENTWEASVQQLVPTIILLSLLFR